MGFIAFLPLASPLSSHCTEATVLDDMGGHLHLSLNGLQFLLQFLLLQSPLLLCTLSGTLQKVYCFRP